jgi:glycosyltransferase involved in cell wall biosynthesis
MSVLFIEPKMFGHHAAYLKWCIRAAQGSGHRVLLGTTQSAVNHDAFQELLGSVPDDIEVIVLRDLSRSSGGGPKHTGGVLRTQIENYQFLRSIYAEARTPDFVFLPYIDACAYMISLFGAPFGHTPWAGIAMRPNFHYRDAGLTVHSSVLSWAKKRIFLRLLSQAGLQKIFSIDPTLYQCVIERHVSTAERLAFLADPADELRSEFVGTTDRYFSTSNGEKLVLVAGAISQRKGVMQLFRAMDSRLWPAEVRSLIVGEWDSDMVEILNGPQVQRLERKRVLHVENRYLDDGEFAGAVDAADFIWCGYKGHLGMSGMLSLAGQAGKPVIACSDGLIGSLTKGYRSGLVLSDLDPDTIAEGVRQLADNEDLANQMSAAARAAYFEYSVENAERLVGALW